MSKGTETNDNPFAGFNLLDERPTITSKTEEPIKIEEAVVEPVTEPIVDEEVETPEDLVETPVIKPPVEADDEDFSYKPIIDHLIKRGVLDVEDEELKDEDFSDDSIIEKVTVKTVERKIQKKLEQYPEKLKKAIEWVDNGGDIDQFYNYYYNNIRYSDISLSADDAEMQKAILSDYLSTQGHDEDVVKNKIEKYELSGILEDEADTALKQLQKIEAKQEKEREETQKTQKEQKRIKELEEWNNLKKAVLEAEEIAGFTVTPKVREKLWEHMTKVVDKASGKTKLQLNNETKGLNAKLLYAYLDMVDFDISKLEKQVKSKVTSDLRKNLGKFSDGRAKPNGSRSHVVESTNDLSAFRNLDLRNK